MNTSIKEIVFPLASFTMAPRHALFSSAMPFFPAPCPFSDYTFCALHFGKKFVKIGQNIRKLQDFLSEVCRNKFGKIYDHDFQLLIALIPCLL